MERLDFWERISVVMKGLWGLDRQVTVLKGACLSKIVVRVLLKRCRYGSSDVGGEVVKDEERISLTKLVKLIERKWRTSLVISLVLLWDGTEIEKTIARWSERAGSVELTEDIILDEEWVRSKSRVWSEWVGNLMCWVREKSLRRLIKWEAEGQLGWSTWKLKSPVIINSEFDVARSSRRVENSEMKVDLEEAGGRYIVRRRKEKEELFVREKLAQKDSKEEKAGKGILDILMWDRNIKARPPPRPVVRGEWEKE